MVPRPAQFPFNRDVQTPVPSEGSSVSSRVAELVSWPAFSAAFKAIDTRAKAAKAASRQSGLAAISFGTLALLVSALSPVLESWLSEGASTIGVQEFGKWIGVFAVACAVLSVMFGSQVLHGKTKRAWLSDRMTSERLRQFKFQLFPRTLDMLAAAARSDADLAAFVHERDGRFDQARGRFIDASDAELTNLLDEDCEDDGWLLPRPKASMSGPITPELERIFTYYRDWRIQHQINYANIKLKGDRTGLSEIEKSQYLDNFSVIAVVMIFAMYMIWLAMVVFSIGGGLSSDFESGFNLFVHVVTLTLSVLVLGARAVEAGLQPAREVERLLAYRAQMRAAKLQFDAADTIEGKVAVMEGVEQAAFQEMLTFLRTQSKARFQM